MVYTVKENKKKLVKHQEHCYHSDLWSFFKSVYNGTIGNAAAQPTFSVNQANDFYCPRYSQIEPLNKEAIKWFPSLPTTDIRPFCMDPIYPKDVRSALQTRSNSSSPGPDGINYAILKKWPAAHLCLVTLYTQILKYGSPPPKSWTNSNVTLIHKKGDTNLPTNFRMIALGSTCCFTNC